MRRTVSSWNQLYQRLWRPLPKGRRKRKRRTASAQQLEARAMLDGYPWITVGSPSATAPDSLVFTVDYGNMPDGTMISYSTSGGNSGYDYTPLFGSFDASGDGSITLNVATLVDNMAGSDMMSLDANGGGADGWGMGTIYEPTSSGGGDSSDDSQPGAAPYNFVLDVPAVPIAEGNTVTASGSFNDSDFSDDSFTGSINWGDGQVDQLPSLMGTGIQGFHAYNQAGVYTVSATVTDDDNDSVSAAQAITIIDPAPTVSGFAVDPANEGDATRLRGSISDPAQGDDYSATIHWGDGSSETAGYQDNDPLDLTHTYEEAGTYTVTAAIADEDGESSTSTTTAVIADPVPQIISVVPQWPTIDEGQSTNVAVQFDDALTDSHTVTIDWGDGASAIDDGGPGQSLYMSPPHRYAEPGTYTITATVADDDGQTGRGTTTLTVDDPVPSNIVITPSAQSVMEGQSFNLSGSFNDPAAADTHTVTIDWGDGGTSTATVNQANQTFVTPTHRYLDEPDGGGAYTIKAIVSDEDGKTGTGTIGVSIADAPITDVQLTASPSSNDASASVSGSFSDPAGNADLHTVAIAWGDGSSSSAAVDEATQTFTAPLHEYPNVPAGGMTFSITALVSDEDGTTASASTTVMVTPSNTVDSVVDDITITAPQPLAFEKSGQAAQLIVTRGSADGMEIVDLQATGSASLGTDYYIIGTDSSGRSGDWLASPAVPSQGSVVFYPGASSVTLDLVPIDDQQAGDPNRTAQLWLSGDQSQYVLSNPPPPTVTIVNDNFPNVSVQANPAAADAASGATGTLIFSRDVAAGEPLTVTVATAGTATPGLDYVALPSSVTIPAGSSSVSLTVTPIDNGALNAVRQAIVVPVALGGTYTLSLGSDTTTPLAYDAGAVTVQMALEALPGVGAGNVLVVGSGTADDPFIVAFKGLLAYASLPVIVGDGTNLMGVAITDAVIAAKAIYVSGSPTLDVSLTPEASYEIVSPSAAAVTVAENFSPQVSIAATTNTADERLALPGEFTVTRIGPDTYALTIDYSVSGTATNFELSGNVEQPDFPLAGASGSITIPAGQFTAAIDVVPTDAGLPGPNQTVTLSLLAPADNSYTLASASSDTVTILEDDPPQVSVQATQPLADELARTPGVFTVTRNGPTDLPLVVSYATSGSATNYDSLSGSVAIPAGSSSATIDIDPVNANLAGPNEDVTLTLAASSDGSYAIALASSDTVVIAEDAPPAVTLQATTPTADEDAGAPGAFTITRNSGLAGDLTVAYSIGGTALPGAQYQPLSGSVLIPAGEASTVVSITPIDDGESGTTSTVVLTLATSASGSYTLVSASSDTVTLLEDDPPSVSILATAPDASATDGTPGVFTVTRSGGTNGPLTVSLNLSGSAVNGTDFQLSGAGFQPVSNTLTIPAGQSSATITVTPIDNGQDDDGATVVFSLASSNDYNAGSQAASTVTIHQNSSPLVSIVATQPDANKAKGTVGVFTITRTGDTTNSLSVDFDVSGSAAADDFALNGVAQPPATGSVTIPAGQSSATVDIAPQVDVPADETVTLALAGSTDYELGSSTSAIVTIKASDIVTIAATQNTAYEPAGLPGTLTVTRAGPISQALTVAYAVSGTASGAQYQPLSGYVTLPAGSATATISVDPVPNSGLTTAKTVIVTINAAADGRYALGDEASDTVTIDGPPTATLQATQPDANEQTGDAGAFTVTLSSAEPVPITLSYSLSGTAQSGTDFQSVGSFVTIPAGQTTATITVAPLNAHHPSGSESLILTLAAAGDGSYLTASPTSATVNIQNLGPPTISIQATADGSLPGDTAGQFTITRGGDTSSSLTVPITVGGTAVLGADFQLSGAGFQPADDTITLPAGATAAVVTVTPISGDYFTGNRTVSLTLAAATDASYQLGSPADATIAITGDALPLVSIIATQPTASVPGGQSATLTITRTGPTPEPLTIDLSLGGPAANGADYQLSGADFQAASSSLTIPAGSSTATLSVVALNNGQFSTTANFSLANSSDYNSGASSNASVTIIEQLPTITLQATQNTADAPSHAPGAFTITRNGPTSAPLSVAFSIGGTGVLNTDFQVSSSGTNVAKSPLAGSVVIPVGSTSATITVTPLVDTSAANTETVVLTTSASGQYNVGDPSSDTVTIDQDLTPAIEVFDGGTLIPAGTGSDDFGATPQGVPLIKTFSLTNVGANTVSFTPGSLSVPRGFSVATWPPATLAPGATAHFAVALNASIMGVYFGAISFRDSDTRNSPYTFQVTATVTPPRPTSLSIGGMTLVDDTGESESDSITYDPRVTAVVNGVFPAGYAEVEFDDGSAGLTQGITQQITASGTSITYDPRTGDPALATYTGPVDLHYRLASFDTAGNELDGAWNDFTFTMLPVPTGAHVDHMRLVNDTGPSATDRSTYDPRVTAVVNGPFAGPIAEVDFTIVPGSGPSATGVVSAVITPGQSFTFNPLIADPALAGYSGPLTLQYHTVDDDASGNIVNTGDTQTFAMSLYAPTPNVSVSGFGLFDDTDPAAATLSTADPRLTGSVSGVPTGEKLLVQFSHHGDGVINGSVAVSASNLSFTYDPRNTEPALQTFVGLVSMAYRTVEFDAQGGEIDGPWQSFPFTMEQATSPATIANLQLTDVTGQPATPPATSDPTLSGKVVGTSLGAAPTVQLDFDGDGVSDASTTASSTGAFTILPPNLPYGNVTIAVRAVEYDTSRRIYLYGAWTSISFTYQPPPAPAIESFTLSHDTGGTANPGHTTDDSLQGTIAAAPLGDTVQVEFDTDNNGIANTSIPVYGTSFSFQPDWLPFGPVTILARTVLSAASGSVISYGDWTPLSFTYLPAAAPGPAIVNLGLTQQTGTSDGLPTAAQATVTGTISVSSAASSSSGVSASAYQTVEYALNGDQTPDGATTTDANGDFTFTPPGLAAGTVTISVRAKAWDTNSQSVLTGSWSALTFDYEPPVQVPVGVSQLSLASPLPPGEGQGEGGSNQNGSSTPEATDPTVSGQLSVANDQGTSPTAVGYLTVQVDTNGDGVPDASVTADADGAFQITPPGLAFGTVTVAARAQYYDYSTDQLANGPWTSVTFDYEQMAYTPPAIGTFALASDTGGAANPGQTANPTVSGTVVGGTWSIAGAPAPDPQIPTPQSATTFIEFDSNGDGVSDATVFPDADGNFIYTPKYLSYGPVTINARAVGRAFQPDGSAALVAGAWTPLSFTYLDQPDTAPVLTSLGLADSTGAVTTATTSTDGQPTVAGQITYEGALAGVTIQFDTTGGTTPNATAITDAYGRFQFSPSGLAPGTVTIEARTYAIDDVTKQVLMGAWSPLSFTWQPPAPSPLSVGSLVLADPAPAADPALVGPPAPNPAADATVTGQLSGDGDVGNQIVQFAVNAVANGSTITDAGGNFTYTPSGLANGTVTVSARVEDTAADGTPIYSPWTSLTMTLTSSAAASVSQLVLANPAVVAGAANPAISTSATVSGQITGASVSGMTVEFDTDGDGQPNASTTTDAGGAFSFTPGVSYGIVTIAARVVGQAFQPDATTAENPSPWATLSFVYASDPNSATAQTELSTLSQAASALAAAKSASSLTTANGNYASAETTAAGTYHKLEAGAANTYQTTTAPAEANDASQTASAIGPYDLAASQAASGLTTSLASFAGDSTSYSIADLAQWPDAPPVPSADDSYQPTPPVSAPTYSGPVFDVQEDHGYQINVGLAEGDYNTAIENGTNDYNTAVDLAMDGPNGYKNEIAQAKQEWYQAMVLAVGTYNSAAPPAWTDPIDYKIQYAGAMQPFTKAAALADQAYSLAAGQAEQNRDDALAKAVRDRAYAVADAESTLTQAVANANAAAFADWSSAEGTPWTQFQSQLAANEAQFYAQDAPAKAVMAKGEADAQYAKAQALDQAAYDDQKTVADALESAQVNDSLARKQLDVSDAQAQQACNAAKPDSVRGFADAEAANDLVAEPVFEQDAHDYALAQATALADFHQANGDADRDSIIATALADQTFGDDDAGYQASLDVANSQAEQTLVATVSNAYTAQMEAWALTDGSPWAVLEADLAADDGAYAQAMAQANLNQATATSAANVAWTLAYDAAGEQQAENDAKALADSVTAAATAQITAATTTLDAVKLEAGNDIQDQAGFNGPAAAARASELDAVAVPDPETIASVEQAASQTIDPLEVNLAGQIGDEAVTAITTQAGANKQLNIDEANAAYTLAKAEADDEKTAAYAEAQADNDLAHANDVAASGQAQAAGLAQAQLDLSAADDQSAYQDALADNFATQMAAVAAADGTPLTAYWSAMAAAHAAQADANVLATQNYEIAATGADAQLSGDQASAEYDYAEASSGAELLDAKQTADAVHTQEYFDAQYASQLATDAANALSQHVISTIGAQRDDANAAAQIAADWDNDRSAANLTAATALMANWLANVQPAYVAALTADGNMLGPQLGEAGITLAQALGAADVAVATAVGNDDKSLAGDLASDANAEAVAEQGAVFTDAQTVDAAAVTRATALRDAQNNYATTNGNAQIAETHAEGLASVTLAGSAATAEADYLVAAATADDNSAQSWRQTDGSAQSVFEAAYADAELAWLKVTAPAFVTDKTTTAQNDADYADQAATLGAAASEYAAGQDGSLAVTLAQLAQTEEDTIAGDEQTYALAQTSEHETDLIGRAGALADRALAAAKDNQADLQRRANDGNDYDTAIATGDAYTAPPFDNTFATAEANANFTWVAATTLADSNEQKDLAIDDQGRGDDEAIAEQSYAHHGADAQWSHDENVAANQESTAALVAGDEQTREENNAAADADLQTAEYNSAATQLGALAAAIGTPWAQYLAGAAGAKANWWTANLPVYLNYQNALASDQSAETISMAQAVQTEADARADADRQLAYDTADAAHDQAIDDDAAQQVEQAADADNNVSYQQGLAQGQVDYQTRLKPNDASDATTTQEDDVTAANQTYLSDERAAQDTLVSTTGGDALTDSTAVANAQLTWTKAGDAATEGYLYSTGLAADQQSDDDALATAGYQSTSSAAYASAMQSYDLANPSPWADYASAMAGAQASLIYTTANALSGEQIALADANFAQSWADALAQQGLDDGQATADTGLVIGQQTAASTLATGQALSGNAASFQYSATSDQLPGGLISGVSLSLTAWETSWADGTVLREGVTIAGAWAYQAGYVPASGFGYTAATGYSNAGTSPDQPWSRWLPSGLPQAPGNYLRPPSSSQVTSVPIDFDWQLPGVPVNLSGEAPTLAVYAYVLAANTIVAKAPLPSLYVLSGGVVEPLLAIAAPTPDDAAHQDASGDTFGFGFDGTPLATLSAESQAADAATPTATEAVKETEQKASDDAAASDEQVLQEAMQTVALGADMSKIPLSRIENMWGQGVASFYKPDPAHIDKHYAYVVDAFGNQLITYVFRRRDNTVASFDGDTSFGEVYSLVSARTIPLDDWTGNVEEMLTLYRTQAKANEYIELALSDQQANRTKLVAGTLEFTLNLVPFGSAADNFTQAYQATNAAARRKFLVEGSISLAGDIATIASLGVGTTLKSGAQIASREVIRNVRIGAAVVDYGLGGVRAAQGVMTMYNGEDGAMGYFGEATLMMLGASSSLIAEVKAARLAKAAGNGDEVANFGPSSSNASGVPDALDGPNGRRSNGIDSIFPNGPIFKQVSASDVAISYVHGTKGDQTVDKIASVLQDVTVSQTNQLREWAALAATRGNQTLDQVIPGFAELPASVRRYLNEAIGSKPRFGSALHDLVEKSLRDSGMLATLDLKPRSMFAGTVPDYQLTFPNGDRAVFDLTTFRGAGKIWKYLQDDTLFLVEILYPGP